MQLLSKLCMDKHLYILSSLLHLNFPRFYKEQITLFVPLSTALCFLMCYLLSSVYHTVNPMSKVHFGMEGTKLYLNRGPKVQGSVCLIALKDLRYRESSV